MDKSSINGVSYLSSLFKECELAFNCQTKEEYIAWKNNVLSQLRKMLGMDLMKKTDPNPQVISCWDMGTYKREKISFNTQENLTMFLFKLTPINGNNIPVVAVHGHGSDGKYGLAGIYRSGSCSHERSSSYTYALDMVERGYTVFIPDLLGSGDRKLSVDINKVDCTDLNNVCISLGITLLGIHIYDMLCLADYIKTCSELDMSKLIFMGFSGGAILTLLTSVFCEDIFFTVVSGFFHGFKDTMLTSNLCGCNFVPNLWNKIDMGDLGALIAPRHLYIETGNQDLLNGSSMLENVYPQLEVAKKAYALFDSSNLYFNIFEGGHQWYGGCYDIIEETMGREIYENGGI